MTLPAGRFRIQSESMSRRRSRKRERAPRAVTFEEAVSLEFDAGLGRAVLQGDPGNIAALQMTAESLTRMGQHKEALALDRRIVQLLPDDPISHYNLACSFSLTEHIDEAILELEAALGLGYRDIPRMLKDHDLRNARRDPRFQKLVELRWGRRRARRKRPPGE